MADILTQYRIIARGAGWIDKAGRGRLRFDGADALRFLQALLTNDVGGLAPGQGAYAAYLTPQGRMIADLRIYSRGAWVMADVPPGRAAELAEAFDRVIFTEDVRVADISTSTSQLAVVGPRAAEALAHVFGIDAARVRALPCWSQIEAGDGVVVRTDDALEESYDVVLPAESRESAIARLAEGGVEAIAAELAEALRIDAGRPAFGIDMTDETIPLEAGLLERAISTTKGCYVGQEVIVRVLHRGGGRVAKRLVRLVFDAAASATPVAGAVVTIDGRDRGTSEWSPLVTCIVTPRCRVVVWKSLTVPVRSSPRSRRWPGDPGQSPEPVSKSISARSASG
jgi:folate-binding protein YgfZ